MIHKAQKGPLCNLQTMQAKIAYAQADQGLHCPLTESMETVVYVNKQRMLRSDCADAHTDLDIHCPQVYRPFSCIVHHMIILICLSSRAMTVR